MQAATSGSRERQPRHAARAILITGALIAAIAVPATAFAAKGGSTTTTSWIALATTDGQTLSASVQPRLGSTVKFASRYPSTAKNPWVSLNCWQDGTLVYGQGGAPSSDFGLGGASSDWINQGGAATCIAELGDLYWRGGQQYYTYFAHTSFDAAG